MSREWIIYVRDMVTCCDKVIAYTDGLSRETFDDRGMAFDAVVRNLELLGEAATQLSEEIRAKAPDIEWRKLIGLRNVLIHGYFGVDEDILWDLVQNKVRPLREALQAFESQDEPDPIS
jgi:uncharacterized protein with HEPN domain